MTEKSLEEINTPIDNHFYQLVDKEPVRCTFAEYAQNMQSESNRIVMQTQINALLISTIFTGIDYSFGTGEKRLFETMIFGMDNDIHPKWQHATWQEATEKHQELAETIKNEGVEFIKKQIQDITNNNAD